MCWPLVSWPAGRRATPSRSRKLRLECILEVPSAVSYLSRAHVAIETWSLAAGGECTANSGCGPRLGSDAPVEEAERASDPMIEEIRERMVREIEQLNRELHVVLPEALRKARELGDLRENGDYQAAIERQQFVQARLNHLRDRLSRISSIDLSKVPRDRVGLGSIVTVLDLETNDREVFELVIPDAMDLDEGHVSVSSPLGRALLDLKVGDEAGVQLPFGTRNLKIEKLQTIHAQLKSKGGESPSKATKPKRRPKATKRAKKKG